MKFSELILLIFLAFLAFYVYLHKGQLPVAEITQTVQNQIQKLEPVPSPSPDIAALADKADMTQEAKDIFYRAHPVIDTDRTKFESDCHAPVSTNTTELGCYSTDGHIYILAITDPQLQDQMIVTAAHEMLHAAYQQLSDNERNTVNTEIENDLPSVEDQALAQELRSYQMTEPGERDNELHSILGTEYAPLSSELETYYSQYFTNRGTVVAYAKHFDQIFTDLETQLNSLLTQIRTTRRTMRLDLRNRDIEGYNALVPQINNMVDTYNTDVDQYNQLSRSLKGEESPDPNSGQ